MLSAQHRRVAQVVCDRLLGRDLLWAVTGSVALALQGVLVECDDLDLVTTAAGAAEIEDAFASEVVVRTGFGERDGIRGHLGLLRVENLAVEVLGDIQNALPGGMWTMPPRIAEHREWIALDDRRCPVLSLVYMREAYAAMGRDGKANIIAERLADRLN